MTDTKNIYWSAIETFGYDLQITVAIEEMAELTKELEGLRTESPEGEKRLPHRLVRIRITAKVPVWPEYQPRIGATYRAERYPMFKAPGYVIESGGKRINIRADECVEV